MSAVLYTDGGARGNPGPAGIGYMLEIPGQEKVLHGEYIGETTNNQAEYKALIAGLARAVGDGASDIVCYLDSELVVKQLNGQYRVKHADMKPLYEAVKTLEKEFTKVSYKHVPRSKNKVADGLVNNALDART